MATQFHPAVRRGAGIGALGLSVGLLASLVPWHFVGIALLVLMTVLIALALIVMVVGVARGRDN